MFVVLSVLPDVPSGRNEVFSRGDGSLVCCVRLRSVRRLPETQPKNLCALRAAGLLFWQEVSRYVEPYVDLTRSQSWKTYYYDYKSSLLSPVLLIIFSTEVRKFIMYIFKYFFNYETLWDL